LINGIERLVARLAYRFNDPALLEQALTHRSVSSKNNERLEYLGDAVLGLCIADELFQRYPAAAEGELSRLRASLVRGKTLSVIAADLKLGDYIRLGQGELKSGGGRRLSILAGGMEALIGAIYLDGGLDPARRLILSLWQAHLSEITPDTLLKDPKTRLQEYLQARRQPLPAYTVTGIEGSEHNQTFHVSCQVTILEQPTTGSGSSRRKAEQRAAELALQQLEQDG
jgi:ribonuclease-3